MKDLEQLILIYRSIKSHYEEPVIAPNGKAEGLCLIVRGLKGIIEKEAEKQGWSFNG